MFWFSSRGICYHTRKDNKGAEGATENSARMAAASRPG